MSLLLPVSVYLKRFVNVRVRVMRVALIKNISVVFCLCVSLLSCAPKVGSPEWCDAMDKKAKGDWSMNEAKDYAKHCIFRSHEK